MAKSKGGKKGPAGLPSKNQGMKSGKDRDNVTEKKK